MPRTLFIWALIVLVPGIDLRMICIDHPVRMSADAGCTDTCPRPERTQDASTTDCVLVAGGCSAINAFVVALPAPSTMAFAAPPMKFVAASADSDHYLPPSASPLSPPPKA